MKKIRLFINSNQLNSGQVIKITNGQFDYLIKVMRGKIGDEILVFNGKDGEFLAEISSIGKKDCQLEVKKQTQKIYFPSKIILAFAPVKNVRIDFVAAKATELGIAEFQPIVTHHSIVDKINDERFLANIIEAAEQCERLDLPNLKPIIKLDNFLKNLKPNQILILCDESGNGGKAREVLSKINFDKNQNEIIIFIGPEGGFSKEEFVKFRNLNNLHAISLGPRILRSDTAIISAITLVQEFLGDF